MHYYIDGYNMLFRLMHHAKDNLQAGREAIITDLNKKTSLLNINATIVFDAPFQFGEGTRTHFDQLEILFTAEGETADEFILEQMKESIEPRNEIVVTSDKKLALCVRNWRGQTQSVEEFWEWLNRTYKNKCRHKRKEQKNFIDLQLGKELPSPPQISTGKVPDQGVTLEQCEDYYAQIFSDRWQKIEEEEIKKKRISKEGSCHPPPRQPKKRKDPFLTPESQESKEANQMERWLKIFEKRSES